MIVKIIESVVTPVQQYTEGMVYDVPDVFGREWCDRGLAEPSNEIPHDVRALFDRLDIGKDGTALFLPHIGEFGHEVMTQMRIVHFNRARHKIVCCRPGNECLYPSATQFVTTWNDPMEDLDRCGCGEARQWPDITQHFPGAAIVPAGGLTHDQELCAINPRDRIPFTPKRRNLRKVDVLLGVRNRGFAPEKNWPHWQQLADALADAGLTFAVIGTRGTSHDLEGQEYHTGDIDTAAALELLMQPNALFVGTDSGAAHLAATVGTRMIVFRQEQYRGHRNLIPRMEMVNPGRITHLEGVWDQPMKVIAEVVHT
jgi:hypothetical protein